MNTTSQQRRDYSGPQILNQGFRLFFLGAALWAALVLGLWIIVLSGLVELPTRFASVDWHVHELLFGYSGAVIAGFLLTAVPNWTGRYPISGWPLLGLFLLWLAGRLAVMLSSLLDPVLVGVVDLAFVFVLASAIARELIAGKNFKNLRVLILLVLFGGANLWFHIEVSQTGVSDTGTRLGIGVVLVLIMLIGGRVIPSFTRNWLAQRSKPLPVPFNRFDGVCIAISAMSLLVWSVWETQGIVPYLLAISGILNLVRLARWRGYLTFAEPLVMVLHVGFLFVPLGFLAMGVALVRPDIIAHGAATHLWSAGAIGMMTVAVMTRASLGHTDQPLRADWIITTIYIALFVAVILRFVAGLGLGGSGLLHMSATGWIVAYGGFVVRYAPSFIKSSPKPTGRSS